jgi:predicted alpha/beta hydrolase family esterase
MVVKWALAPTRAIRGALLATPADVERALPSAYPRPEDLEAGGWLPMPRMPLPFPSIVAASHNDPLADFDRVALLAESWGSTLHDAGHVGHLNPPTGFGPWPEGLDLIAQLAR